MTKTVFVTAAPSRPIPTNHQVRSSIAAASSCTPFEVSITRSYSLESTRLVSIDIATLHADRLRRDALPWHVVELPHTCSAQQASELFTHCSHALSFMTQFIRDPQVFRFVTGRPVLLSAAFGNGVCRLDDFSLSDFRVYRFASPEHRRRAYYLHQWAQRWLSGVTSNAGWQVDRRPGCVVSMAAGSAIAQ